MIDVECLIMEIEKHECIWKTTCKRFLERDTKRKSWIDIAMNMFENWETFSIKEQEDKIEELKKKWKNIRDNYTRDVNDSRRIVSGSEAPKKNRTYAYANVLSFLRPIVKKRKTTGNINHTMDNALDVSSNDNEVDVEGNSSSLETPLECSVTKTKLSSSSKKKAQTTSFQDALLDAITNPSLFFQTPPEVDDPDKAFLLSFLPDIKKLNDEQKMELKFQFFQSLRTITQSASQPQNIYNSPSSSNSSVYHHNMSPNFPYPYSYNRPIGSSTATTSYAFPEPLTQNSSYTGPPQTLQSLEQSNSNQYVFK
ncbi:unnamed protein product [Macrosiphum euphorbiae]|uniref:MADF domain-containing protein n=2 Tax=Macrosiphum euphorbiae TaxID=13131 RepID=A0AAV0WHM1_9HEMI|nr:unnamed protein product [Macrosiphum euphorbiae]